MQGVRVLELINGDKGKAAVPFVMHIRVTAQQTLRQNEQVIKVYGVLGLQFTLVGTGNGSSKKRAEQDAARAAMEALYGASL